MIDPALAEVLRGRRGALNARFAAARRRWPQLEPADFLYFLREQLSPLAAAVAAASPAQVDAVATLGYELGLQLVAEKIAGPAALHPAVNRLWQTTLPAVAPLVAADPRALLGSLCNAAHQIATTPGAQALAWCDRLAGIGPRCGDSAQLLAVGQLLAWRAGLAHYRSSALDAGDRLPPALAVAALDAPAGGSWLETRAAHQDNPWLGYDFSGARVAPPREPRRIGTFRGFGGVFSQPPTVAANNGQLYVFSGGECWLLAADIFGSVLHRTQASAAGATALPFASRRPASRLPPGQTVTSSAALAHTFAFTTAESHAVWIGPAAAP